MNRNLIRVLLIVSLACMLGGGGVFAAGMTIQFGQKKTVSKAPVTEERSMQETEDPAEADTESVTDSAEESDAGTEQTEAETETASSETEASEETVSETEAASEPVGLEAFFQGRAIIDPAKVELYLNVREEPDDDSKILSVMFPDTILPVVSEKDGWYEVQCDGYTGYVNKDYVLTDSDAYHELEDSVGYAVMAAENEIILYAEPDENEVPIQVANKGDAYRVLGQSGDFYRVSVVSPVYEYLYVPKRQVVLYYLFLGPGNSNELDADTQAYLHSLNIAENLQKTEKIVQEAQAEKEAYEAYLAEYESSIAAEEAQQKAEREAAAQAAANAAWASMQAESAAAAQQTQAQSGMQYLGVFMITSYCHCQICCGVWGSNDPNYVAYGSSGMRLVDGQSVAVDPSVIPYGTKLLINGNIYIAADSGVSSNIIDIYRSTHAAALSMGATYAEVYILY